MTILVNGELVLTGFVGESFWHQGFTSTQVIDALAEKGPEEDVVVRLNSGGGYAYEGIAIFNAFKAHQGKVTIYIEAVAASAASVIAMAGDEIIMRLGANMMIHDPSGITFGTAQDFKKALTSLDRLASSMAAIYAATSGEEKAAIRTDMESELWLSAEEAVNRGYATQSEEGDGEEVAAFDYGIYANAPKELKALASQNNWKFTARASEAAPPKDPDQTAKETPPMGNKNTPGGAPPANTPTASEGDEKARIQAILSSKEGQANTNLAQHLAFNTDQTAESAIATLQAAAPESNDDGGGAGDKPNGGSSANPEAYQHLRSTARDLSDPVSGGGENKPQAKIDHTAIFASRRGGGTS